MIEAAKSDVAAFVDGLSDSIDDIYQSVIVDLNRMAYGDGMGLLGTVAVAQAKGADTDADWSVTFEAKTGVKYFKPGMLVDFYAANGVAPTAAAGKNAVLACRVAAVYPSSNKVKFEETELNNPYRANHPISPYATIRDDAEVNLPVSCIAIKMGAREIAQATTEWTSLKAREMMGLLGIFDNDTKLVKFQNIDTGNYPEWQANVLGNSSVARELSIDLLLQALDLTRVKAGKQPDRMFMGLGQRRKYANLLLPDVRFQPTVLKGGYETLTFAGGDGTVTMVVDPMCQNEHIFMEPTGTVQRYEMTPLGWGNMDQQWHQRSSYDEYDAFLRLYCNLGTEARSSLTLLKDLVEPSLYA